MRLGVLNVGQYQDHEWRKQLLELARFRTTASAQDWRSLKEYVGALKENQIAIYYVTRLENSPHLEGFRARAHLRFLRSRSTLSVNPVQIELVTWGFFCR